MNKVDIIKKHIGSDDFYDLNGTETLSKLLAAMDEYAQEQVKIKDKIERGLINEELEPIKCECGSTEFIDKTTDKIDFMEVEKDRFCKKCNKLVGYWSYGHWLP